MACKKRPETKSFLANTVGSVGMEQIMVVATVGLLGLGGFTVLGGTMRDDIASNGPRGGAKASMAVASEAGVFIGDAASDLSLCGDGKCGRTLIPPVPPVGPTAAAEAARVIAEAIKNAPAKELHFGHKHHGTGEGFLDGLKRTAFNVFRGEGPGDLDWLLPGHGTGADDILRGIATKEHDLLDVVAPDAIMNPLDRGLGLIGFLADQALPGKGLLPGDILDGVLPGTGFRGNHGLISWVGDLFNMNDERHTREELAATNYDTAYDHARVDSAARSSRLKLVESVVQLMNVGASLPEGEFLAALATVKAMTEEPFTHDFGSIARDLERRGASYAADAFKELQTARDKQEKRLSKSLKDLATLAKESGERANPALVTARQATVYAQSLIHAAKGLDETISPVSAGTAYTQLTAARDALVMSIENYDMALVEIPEERRAEADYNQLATDRYYLNVALDRVEASFAQLNKYAPAFTPPAPVDIGTAIVQEQGGAVVTR